ncbi:M15 family metallopeptidase [Massilia sp. IC2-278]|uniref:M15 family metallopeptidase n=1 Tax=Massilia sp. IC2-278 TaxID=2887200 RepID=UPI001E2C78AB|nr:M15 family metallopeptidase [Massilia sp. IC2-278]MCC2959020.1 M15 family metallopeptidase [Massilia sp. IC2-278]
MLIFLALLYFCVACSLIWLACFPTGRAMLGQFVFSLRSRMKRRDTEWRGAPARERGAFRRGLAGGLAAAVKLARRNWIVFAIGVPVIAIPSLLALVLRSPAMLPDYVPTAALPDAQIAALLEGEQLVPPVAPPPLAFTTQEVVLVRPMLVSASRNWGLLHPDFNARLLLAFKIMKEQHGYEMALLEGYRSPARQDLLAQMGGTVTNARAFQSWHQYGLAADCAFWRDGKLVISEKDPWAMRGYRLYGEVAEQLGLTWGGRWKMMDLGHTELRLPGVMRR